MALLTNALHVPDYFDLLQPPEVWEVLTSVNDGVNVRFAKELVRKSEPDEKQEADAEWGDAYLFGPSESIVACAEDGTCEFEHAV